jgi:aminopeptidase N
VLDRDGTGRVRSLRLDVADRFGRNLVWLQHLQVTLGYPDGTRHVPVDIGASHISVNAIADRESPLFVLPNGGGIGYGLFLLDKESRAYLLANVERLSDALTRGSAWVTLWDNMLEGAVDPLVFLDSAMRALPKETDEQNVQRLLGYVVHAFWKFLPPETRTTRGPALESLLRHGIQTGRTEGEKAAWFNAYRDTVMSRDGLEWLARVWRREATISGLTFAETDEIDMALELAVREVSGWEAILSAQLARTENPDRKARFAFVMPALSADEATREQSFDRFRDVANRRREPWVLEALQFLNHPLREAHARRFVPLSLSLLREIQRTGDIFFPTRWMESVLSGHQSREAAETVRRFLADNPDYPERLRWTILTTADELFRAADINAHRTR